MIVKCIKDIGRELIFKKIKENNMNTLFHFSFHLKIILMMKIDYHRSQFGLWDYYYRCLLLFDLSLLYVLIHILFSLTVEKTKSVFR